MFIVRNNIMYIATNTWFDAYRRKHWWRLTSIRWLSSRSSTSNPLLSDLWLKQRKSSTLALLYQNQWVYVVYGKVKWNGADPPSLFCDIYIDKLTNVYADFITVMPSSILRPGTFILVHVLNWWEHPWIPDYTAGSTSYKGHLQPTCLPILWKDCCQYNVQTWNRYSKDYWDKGRFCSTLSPLNIEYVNYSTV